MTPESEKKEETLKTLMSLKSLKTKTESIKLNKKFYVQFRETPLTYLMKRILFIIIGLVCLLSTACTHNNGDIGPLFGKWKVTAIEADGMETAQYAGNIFLNFQSHTVEVTEILPDHIHNDAFGNWSRTGDELMLSFPDAGMEPPASSMLPTQCTLQILHLDSGKATFLLRLSDGATLTYILKKW